MGSNPTLTAILFKNAKRRGRRLNPRRLTLHCVFRYLYLGLEPAWVTSPEGHRGMDEA